MPISLDSFQRTLNTSNAQGFVKLSNDGAGVKSVGGGFFARHFGFYTKPTAEENNAVRRAFYESVANGFHCQGEVLDKLRHDLGIGAGLIGPCVVANNAVLHLDYYVLSHCSSFLG